MGSPQLEDGYTRIANELLDAIIAFDFSKREQNVIFCIIRKTYGFNKVVDDITLTQIANVTGLDLGNVSKTISELSERNILLKRQGRYGYVLGINKNYGVWKPLLKRQQLVKTTTNTCQNNNLTLSKQQPQKTTPKDNPKIDGQFLKFWSAYPKKVAKLKAEESFIKINPDDDLLQIIIESIQRQSQSEQWQKDGGTFIPHPAKWLGQRRWEDEQQPSRVDNDLMAGVL